MRYLFDQCTKILMIFWLVVMVFPYYTSAADQLLIDNLKSKIKERNQYIEKIEGEIEEYENELVGVLEEKTSLKNSIKTLDISRQKLSADIKVTENRKSATTFQIEKLALEIGDREDQIVLHADTIAQNIRELNAAESRSFVETLLSYDRFSDFWLEIDSLQQFQNELQKNLMELRSLKEELETSKSEREERRNELTAFKNQLSDQQTLVEINRQDKNSLLKKTENKESNYKVLIEEREEARKQFEQELASLESELQIAIDPSNIPKPQKGILAAPLEDMFVTQRFGNTSFAQSGAYNGKGHNGADFRAAPGTPIFSTLAGRVTGTGNTDEVSGCYSYGKWVLIKHNNGLSTLYAHLSHIGVKEGTQLSTGDVIGYSGNTGYSTGPHLHFSLFATEGVRVVKLGDIKKVTNCGPAHVPVAPFEAYLNPLEYLP